MHTEDLFVWDVFVRFVPCGRLHVVCAKCACLQMRWRNVLLSNTNHDGMREIHIVCIGLACALFGVSGILALVMSYVLVRFKLL